MITDLGAAAHLDRVVGDQAVAAGHQVERALALADAALPDQQHAQAEHVHEHAVHHLARGQVVLEDGGELADGHRRGHAGAQQRHARGVGRDGHLGRQRQRAGGQHARDAAGHGAGRARRAAPPAPGPAGSCTSLSPKIEHPARPQVVVEAGQRQAGLLDVGTGDLAARGRHAPASSSRTSPGASLRRAKQASHGDDGRGRHVGGGEVSRAPSAGSTSGCAALRGTWRWCGAPAPAPRAAGC